MSFLIVRAVSDDWETFRVIRLRALELAPLAFGSTLARERDYDEQVWRRWVETHPTFLLLDGDLVLGTATGVLNSFENQGSSDVQGSSGPTSVQLVAMFVDPTARGRGGAARLIDAVAEAATQQGARRMLLYVTDVNPVAERCYRRYGFVETGNTVPLPHTPSVLERELALDLDPSPTQKARVEPVVHRLRPG